MLDVTGHPSFGTKIDGIIFITRRGEFAHKTYYLRSFISRQTFLEIIQLLDQVDISINEIIKWDPSVQESLLAGRQHAVPFYFKE